VLDWDNPDTKDPRPLCVLNRIIEMRVFEEVPPTIDGVGNKVSRSTRVLLSDEE